MMILEKERERDRENESNRIYGIDSERKLLQIIMSMILVRKSIQWKSIDK
jgi:hypothetical protein